MRPCGGFTPDMINFARSTNVYKIWADMIAFGGTDMPVGEHYYCPFAGRRDGKNFVYSHEQIMQKYQKNIKMVDRIPDALSGAMGNQMYVATFSTRERWSSSTPMFWPSPTAMLPPHRPRFPRCWLWASPPPRP